MFATANQRRGIIGTLGFTFWLTGAVLTAYAAESNTVSVFGVLEPGQYYTWGIASGERLPLVAGQIITDVVLTVHNIRLEAVDLDPNTPSLIPLSEQRWGPSSGAGYVALQFYVLDNPRYGFWPLRREATDADPFAGFGSLRAAEYQQGNLVYRLSRTHDTNSWTTKIFGNSMSLTLANGVSIPMSSALLEFIDYAGTGDSVGFGIRSSDRRYYYDDITLTVTVQSYAGVYTTQTIVCRIGDGPSPENPYTLTIAASNGSVVVSPRKRAYREGETVVLTAAAYPGYMFGGWSGGALGTVNPITITMDRDKSITANFMESTRSTQRGE